MVNTDVTGAMRNVYHGSGNVTEKRIVWMDLMNLIRVLYDTAELAHSSARILTAPQLQLSAMVPTTAVMALMKRNAPMNVHFLNSSASLVEDVSWTVGSVMEIQIVKITVMKTLLCVTIDLVTQTPNSPARTDAAFPNYGCAISTMIAVMTLMNQHTCVVKRIVRLDGEDALASLTTDAYQNGCSVMEKTIVEMDPMNCQKIVLLAMLRQTSLAKTNVVFLNNGYATSLTIVETAVMRLKLCANINTENVQSLNSSVVMANVYRQDGAAITRTIAATTRMRLTAVASSVRMEPSNVNLDIASLRTSGVTETGIAETCLMKSDVLRDSLTADTVLRAGETFIFFKLPSTGPYSIIIHNTLGHDE